MTIGDLLSAPVGAGIVFLLGYILWQILWHQVVTKRQNGSGPATTDAVRELSEDLAAHRSEWHTYADKGIIAMDRVTTTGARVDGLYEKLIEEIGVLKGVVLSLQRMA